MSDALGSTRAEWTVNPMTGISNSSDRYEEVVADVERLIRGEAQRLSQDVLDLGAAA